MIRHIQVDKMFVRKRKTESRVLSSVDSSWAIAFHVNNICDVYVEMHVFMRSNPIDTLTNTLPTVFLTCMLYYVGAI